MQRFLCWDEKNIAKNTGVTVIQHKPQKKDIALYCQDAWEGVHNGYAGITKVGDKYRFYYRVGGQDGKIFKVNREDIPQQAAVCLAESDDGITFKKVMQNRYEYNGSKENNIVFMREGNLDTFTVFYDPNPECKAEEKFKAFAREACTEFMDLYISEDGLDFKYVEKVGLKGTFDTYNVVMWDEAKKEYRLYFRGFHHPGGGDAFAEDKDVINDIRDIRLATSKDFRNWDYKGLIQFEEGQPDIPMYTNQIVRYYREPNTLIGFPTRYIDRVADQENYNYMAIPDIRKDIIERENREGTALTDCVIMTSTDGFTFNRRENAFITPGVENGRNWWYGNCYPCYGLVETEGADGEPHEISFYMGENYRYSKVDFRRYTVRLDGFFSWYAENKGGEIITKPFVLKNENMFINFSTSAFGSVIIEVLDENGNELEGFKSYTAFGDSTNRPIFFEKELRELVGKNISLKITMKDAYLYSYTFE